MRRRSVSASFAAILLGGCVGASSPLTPSPTTSNGSPSVVAATASAAAVPYRTYSSPSGAWRVDVPTRWHVEQLSSESATVRSYDPQQAPFERDLRLPARPFLPDTELRIDVQFLFNSPRSTASAAADAILAAPDPSRGGWTLIARRDDLIVAGEPSTLLTVVDDQPPRAPLTMWWYFVVSATRERLLIVRAWPVSTSRSAEMDRFVTTLAVR